MARKRANGEGTITRRKDGRWQGAITIGRDEEGKQLRKTVYGRTQAEVRKKLDDLKKTIGATDLTSEAVTLEAYLARWLEEKARQVKPRTIESYKYTIERYINPKLGRVKLTKLTPLNIQTALGHIADEVSAHTGNYCRSVLVVALNQAVRWRILAANPMNAVDKARVEKEDKVLWSTVQVGTFLEKAEGHRLYALFYLAITSGIRIGELLALTWGDLEKGRLQVRRNLTKENGSLVLATTKTSKGRRIVTLAQDTLDVLAAHKEKQASERAKLGDSWQQPDHIFTTTIGTFLDYRNVLREWHKLQDKAEVPRTGLHDARHLHVSLLIRHGLDPKTIADRVGHTNPAFTLRQYAHLFEEQRLAAAVPLEDLLSTRSAESKAIG
ncbi:MAG TPA: site-specific integrase [Trueperaceae bacterium]|nr:site-specific integrase [Trueperaceae bacterium]